MALLHNTNQSLRFLLQLVDRERPSRGPTAVSSAHRILGTAAIEFFDRRDREFIPMLQLPVLHVAAQDAEAFATALRELTSGTRGGFSFRTGAMEELTLQIGREASGAFVVEVGVDLGAWLKETSGAAHAPGKELALFRFEAPMAELVLFAASLYEELQKLPPTHP
ncbi:MAG: hypothetical protein ACJ790_13200 [Myxococcaceae bacterium]